MIKKIIMVEEVIGKEIKRVIKIQEMDNKILITATIKMEIEIVLIAKIKIGKTMKILIKTHKILLMKMAVVFIVKRERKS